MTQPRDEFLIKGWKTFLESGSVHLLEILPLLITCRELNTIYPKSYWITLFIHRTGHWPELYSPLSFKQQYLRLIREDLEAKLTLFRQTYDCFRKIQWVGLNLTQLYYLTLDCEQIISSQEKVQNEYLMSVIRDQLSTFYQLSGNTNIGMSRLKAVDVLDSLANHPDLIKSSPDHPQAMRDELIRVVKSGASTELIAEHLLKINLNEDLPCTLL